AGRVDELTRSLRRVRAAQLDQVYATIAAKAHLDRGYRSATDWLTVTSSEAWGQCRLTVHLAERIQHMPHVKAAFTSGDLAESALRLLADTWSDTNAAAFSRDEHMLLGWALRLAHRDLRMLLDTWKRHADTEGEAAADDEKFQSRNLTITQQHDGTGRIDGVLDPEGLALVRSAIGSLSGRADDDQRTPGQRRADALVAMARSAANQQQPIPGTKRSRPKVIATIAYHDLLTGSAGGSLDTNGGRTVVSTEAIRRLACDAGIHRLIHAPDGTVLDYGRQTRAVSDSLYDQLVARDHGCRLPGCPVGPAACDAHHAIHWSDLGETEPDNLILTCWYHHHMVHEQHWRIEPLGAGHFNLIEPDGQTHELRPPMVALVLPAS
ncbi:MAG: DUF222 domain-containing protein, partial [Acidimicrobiia bacterium]|nr:DUF222 domain-containing protein [Acidimicrobiia bacterium]